MKHRCFCLVCSCFCCATAITIIAFMHFAQIYFPNVFFLWPQRPYTLLPWHGAAYHWLFEAFEIRNKNRIDNFRRRRCYCWQQHSIFHFVVCFYLIFTDKTHILRSISNEWCGVCWETWKTSSFSSFASFVVFLLWLVCCALCNCRLLFIIFSSLVVCLTFFSRFISAHKFHNWISEWQNTSTAKLNMRYYSVVYYYHIWHWKCWASVWWWNSKWRGKKSFTRCERKRAKRINKTSPSKQMSKFK